MSQEINHRADAMEEIEGTMMEVNDIMQNLATVVNEQGDMLDNIEMNMTVRRTFHQSPHNLPPIPSQPSLECWVC
jgi:t-SNARE complex subunit (syntaxin)